MLEISDWYPDRASFAPSTRRPKLCSPLSVKLNIVLLHHFYLKLNPHSTCSFQIWPAYLEKMGHDPRLTVAMIELVQSLFEPAGGKYGWFYQPPLSLMTLLIAESTHILFTHMAFVFIGLKKGLGFLICFLRGITINLIRLINYYWVKPLYKGGLVISCRSNFICLAFINVIFINFTILQFKPTHPDIQKLFVWLIIMIKIKSMIMIIIMVMIVMTLWSW